MTVHSSSIYAFRLTCIVEPVNRWTRNTTGMSHLLRKQSWHFSSLAHLNRTNRVRHCKLHPLFLCVWCDTLNHFAPLVCNTNHFRRQKRLPVMDCLNCFLPLSVPIPHAAALVLVARQPLYLASMGNYFGYPIRRYNACEWNNAERKRIASNSCFDCTGLNKFTTVKMEFYAFEARRQKYGAFEINTHLAPASSISAISTTKFKSGDTKYFSAFNCLCGMLDCHSVCTMVVESVYVCVRLRDREREREIHNGCHC